MNHMEPAMEKIAVSWLNYLLQMERRRRPSFVDLINYWFEKLLDEIDRLCLSFLSFFLAKLALGCVVSRNSCHFHCHCVVFMIASLMSILYPLAAKTIATIPTIWRRSRWFIGLKRWFTWSRPSRQCSLSTQSTTNEDRRYQSINQSIKNQRVVQLGFDGFCFVSSCFSRSFSS